MSSPVFSFRCTTNTASLRYSHLSLAVRTNCMRLALSYIFSRFTIFSKLKAPTDTINPNKAGLIQFVEMAEAIMDHLDVQVSKIGDLAMKISKDRNLILVIEYMLPEDNSVHYCEVHLMGTCAYISSFLFNLKNNTPESIEGFLESLDNPRNGEDFMYILQVDSKNLQ